MNTKPRLIVFASGSKDGGGSGFEELVKAERSALAEYHIVAVVSNHAGGGVRKRATNLEVPFIHFTGPFTADAYCEIVAQAQADFVSLSGWLKLAKGLDPRTTFNIHPGPLPDFGGPGMYGHHVHEAVCRAVQSGRIAASAVTMHFVTDEYDRGPVFCRIPVPVGPNDTADDIARNVNRTEHGWQYAVTNHVVAGRIHWDGKDPDSLRVHRGYSFLPGAKVDEIAA